MSRWEVTRIIYIHTLESTESTFSERIRFERGQENYLEKK